MQKIEGNERLTWEEVLSKYPDLWLAIDECVYEPDDDVNVVSCIVRYADKYALPIAEICDRSGDKYRRYSTFRGKVKIEFIEKGN